MNVCEYTAAKADGISVAKANGSAGNEKWELTRTSFKTGGNSVSLKAIGQNAEGRTPYGIKEARR